MTQPDLFSPPPPRAPARYPEAAGAQATTTSREAAASVDVSRLRRAVLDCLAGHGPLTADECAARLGASVLTIRPRVSELRARGQVVDTGVRRVNQSGRRAAVWTRAPQEAR